MTILTAFNADGSVSGFYDTSLDYAPPIPADAVEITDDEHAALLAGQAAGKRMVRGSDGQPTLADPPPPSLDDIKAGQLAVLQAACDAEIAAGYTSSALGAAHLYPTKDADQLNMSASVVASLLPGIAAGWTTPFWCADGSGAWAMRDHTAAQIQQAGTDGKAMIQTAQVKLADLSVQVLAATDAAAVQAINW